MQKHWMAKRENYLVTKDIHHRDPPFRESKIEYAGQQKSGQSMAGFLEPSILRARAWRDLVAFS